MPLEADEVAELQLPSAAAIDLAVHGHSAVDDRLFHASTGVEESRELQQLAEPDGLAADRNVLDRSWLRHDEMLTDQVPPADRLDAGAPARSVGGLSGSPVRLTVCRGAGELALATVLA